ncbi:MAG: hypothetical protein HY751_05810 [Nitrospinae bacterium]|nr:hypothetical protein [Nitrospinota bacterium]
MITEKPAVKIRNRGFCFPVGWITTGLKVALTGAFFSIFSVTPASAVTWDRVTLHGYLDLEYTQATKPEGEDDPSSPGADNGSFDQHHFNLLTDIHVAPDLWVKAHVEFDHGADSELGQGGIILEYGFGEYVMREWLKFRGGKALTPYGIYNEIHDATPAFISVSVPEMIYKSERRGGFAMMPKWITGLYALGETPVGKRQNNFDYVFYVGNGESVGVNEAQHDANPNKAVGGRLQYSMDDDKFMGGVSYYYGDKAVSEDNLSQNHWGYIVSLNYNAYPLNLMGEYGQSKLGSRTLYAWYGQASYALGRFTPYARYQSIDPSDNEADDFWNALTLGLNIKANNNLFFKFEWNDNRRGENNNDILTPGNEDFSEFRSAITIFF